MACRICMRGSCTESFHSLEEQELYAEALNAYDDADDLKEENGKRIVELEAEIEQLEEAIEDAYDNAREIRARIEEEQREAVAS